MAHIDILHTLTVCLGAALIFGFITQKVRLSPIVGYLLAGMAVGPYSPGLFADTNTAKQFAEIGIILLMFGLGLRFHFSDLLAVKKIALPGAVSQILITTLCTMLFSHFLGWSMQAGIVYGIAISVASTVVLIRVLSDNHNLHTPTGHIAVGWLVVEDLFTIFVLVILPVFFSHHHVSSNLVGTVFLITLFKLSALMVFVLAAGKKLLPIILSFVAKTGARDLFTLVVLVLALGMAVGASSFFGVSMAFGAFLAGMVVGQSDFSARAASEALPMRDAFAVLFFVSVGMLFEPDSLFTCWKLMLMTLAIVIIVKPLAAIAVVMLLRQNFNKALTVGVALAQIGEFSFILGGLGITMKVLPEDAASAIIAASIVSITLNPILYKLINPFMNLLAKAGLGTFTPLKENCLLVPQNKHRVIMVGYGTVGRAVSRILCYADLEVVVIEMDIDIVKDINQSDYKCLVPVHGDASSREILTYAGIENADAIVISASGAPAADIVELVRAINPQVKILIHTNYANEAQQLKEIGVHAVFSGEGAVSAELSKFIMEELSIPDEEFERECKKMSGCPDP